MTSNSVSILKRHLKSGLVHAQEYQAGGRTGGYGPPPAAVQGPGRWDAPAAQVYDSWQQSVSGYHLSSGQQGGAAPPQVYGGQGFEGQTAGAAAAPRAQGYSANPAWTASTQRQNPQEGALAEQTWMQQYKGGGGR